MSLVRKYVNERTVNCVNEVTILMGAIECLIKVFFVGIETK